MGTCAPRWGWRDGQMMLMASRVAAARSSSSWTPASRQLTRSRAPRDEVVGRRAGRRQVGVGAGFDGPRALTGPHLPRPAARAVEHDVHPGVASGQLLGAHLRQAGPHPLQRGVQRPGVLGQCGSPLDRRADVVAQVAVVVEHDGVGQQVQRLLAEVAERDDGIGDARRLQAAQGLRAGGRPRLVLGDRLVGRQAAPCLHRRLGVGLGVVGAGLLDRPRIRNGVEHAGHVHDDVLHPPPGAPRRGRPLLRRQGPDQLAHVRALRLHRHDRLLTHWRVKVPPSPVTDSRPPATPRRRCAPAAAASRRRRASPTGRWPARSPSARPRRGGAWRGRPDAPPRPTRPRR